MWTMSPRKDIFRQCGRGSEGCREGEEGEMVVKQAAERGQRRSGKRRWSPQGVGGIVEDAAARAPTHPTYLLRAESPLHCPGLGT